MLRSFNSRSLKDFTGKEVRSIVKRFASLLEEDTIEEFCFEGFRTNRLAAIKADIGVLTLLRICFKWFKQTLKSKT